MATIATQIPPDTWVKAIWDEYLELLKNPLYQQAKRYYYQGKVSAWLLTQFQQ